MSTSYNGLFYGNHVSSEETFKKALLLYDKIHFVDRPAISFNDFVNPNLQRATTFAIETPFRRLDPLALKGEVEVVCHSFLEDKLEPAILESIKEDIHNPLFVAAFIKDFLYHPWFFQLLFQPSGISKVDPLTISVKPVAFEGRIIEAMRKINWEEVTLQFSDLYNVDGNYLFNPDSKESMQFSMTWFLAQASYILNNSLITTARVDAVPFTDIDPFHNLLISKHARICSAAAEGSAKNKKISYLAHTIFDQIITSKAFTSRSVEDIIEYRRRHDEELSRFREYLSRLQYQIETGPFDAKFETEVEKLIALEVLPKAVETQDKLTQSWENLFGGLAKGVQAAGVVKMITLILPNMPLDKLVTMGDAGALLAWTVPAIVDFVNERRRIKRNNGLAYLIKLNQ